MREGDSIHFVIPRRFHPGGRGYGRAAAASSGRVRLAGAPDACAGAGGAAAFIFNRQTEIRK